jgi:hypothetical protein
MRELSFRYLTGHEHLSTGPQKQHLESDALYPSSSIETTVLLHSR